MSVRVLLAAIAAGLIAGLLMTPVLAVKVVPLIVEAEKYEGGGPQKPAAQTPADGSGHNESDGLATEPASAAQEFAAAEPPQTDFRRLAGSLAANLVMGAGYGLLLAAVSLASGVRVSLGTGLAWGFAGWLCVQLLPALGLPPALPGFPEVDLRQRQIWWVMTVALSIAGFWLLFLYKSNWFRALGVVLLFAPHLWGAPKPDDISTNVPAFIASQYTTASLATTLFFWLVLGLALGTLWDRMKLERP